MNPKIKTENWCLEEIPEWDDPKPGYMAVSSNNHDCFARVVIHMEEDLLMDQPSREQQDRANLLINAPEIYRKLEDLLAAWDSLCSAVKMDKNIHPAGLQARELIQKLNNVEYFKPNKQSE